ncbi:Hypothetical protein PENO1_110230 [Penicillium occitanis (nom. inval.)]|nr:Hypothetical protein PENO1_110230 [Penicillium occitanis (nom. inval.)]PCG88553.1 hypothetical protein PENOC_110510 [Penicillium occitanis (nom. inval.)]
MGVKHAPSKPVFLVTHPRAISTAFERVFLTREHDIVCIHEPFSDAYHWGPEYLSERYRDVEKLRAENGYEDYTYHTALKIINDANTHGKRVFIKDMAKCLMPLHGQTPRIAPSLRSQNITRHGTKVSWEELDIPNPTVIPPEVLSTFHFAFLIRNPRRSIPSLYRCSIPPMSLTTGWHGFKSSDAGYKELRRLFDYLKSIKQIGSDSSNEICIVDADDLLEYPQKTIESFCSSVGIPFDADSLVWDTENDHKRAQDLFRNWAPFHDTALKSTSIMTQPPKVTTPSEDLAAWAKEFGKEASILIQTNVEDNMDDFLYLKQFAISPRKAGETKASV